MIRYVSHGIDGETRQSRAVSRVMPPVEQALSRRWRDEQRVAIVQVLVQDSVGPEPIDRAWGIEQRELVARERLSPGSQDRRGRRVHTGLDGIELRTDRD